MCLFYALKVISVGVFQHIPNKIPGLLIVLLFHQSSNLSLCCTGSVRLVDGGSRCAGRVEVLHRGEWGTVCDDYWDMRDAAVVCRELGCGEAVDALSESHFGSGSGPIWMDDVDCSGSESTLKNCRSPGLDKHNFRLVGGSHCSGRVEVLHGESWVTVCDADFNQQDAEVVCRELGCGSPVEVLEAAAFGRGEGQVWSEELQCRGNESQIHFCPKSSSLKHNCSHDNDVGLVCADSVRLVDGGSRCAGRVEVLHRGQWGTVCSNNWVMSNAAVVCRELGCGESVDALSDSEFGPGSGQIWMNYVDCNGSESTLKNCRAPGWGVHNCDHSKDAGVICSGRYTGSWHKRKMLFLLPYKKVAMDYIWVVYLLVRDISLPNMQWLKFFTTHKVPLTVLKEKMPRVQSLFCNEALNKTKI
uniref:SRCR domain-containing protein n=1 Tax=Astyanax mexicanus TaxID=7994 RepID=A0A3B1K813_ASTMX